ncbi:DNA helicase [Caerostris darwini]|uniref:DNA helicase n=1 Tax=Caerostris darwini TaxID=1538125 RepID=A0AAV4SAN2_9ARAC|nr:DNA helicase [Caerostris darwini]
MERKSILDANPKQMHDKPSSSKHRSSSSMKRHADDDSSRKSDRPLKKKYSDSTNDRKIVERRDSFSDSRSSDKGLLPQKSPSNSYSTPHHGYSNHRDNSSKMKMDRWNNSPHPGNWPKDRYSNDYNKRDHYRNYPRDEGNNFSRGKPHRDYPYPPQDRHNNRYHSGGQHGSFSHYNMHQSSYSGAAQPPPAHSGYNYGSRPAMHPHSPTSQPPAPPGVDHHGDSYSSYQGHADSWRRRSDDHRKDHGSRDYKKN